ncbi:sodium:calcium antiporter, partial [bacterium]|nr:sodium:calcium antiporter [bacterium]
GLAVAGLAALVLGGDLLVDAATTAARASGVSEAMIGLTVVAVGTSLPELATSVVATARGQVDIAIGNVVGSNVFNVLGILGVTAFIRPLPLGGVTWFDLGTMAVLSGLLLVLAFTDRRLDRREGAVLLALYVVYLVILAAG